MTLPAALLALLVQHVPPGHTVFSVEPAADCSPVSAECEGARRSSFYGGAWVRQESPEAGRARYTVLTHELAAVAVELTCRDETGTRVEGCAPAPGVVAGRRWRWDAPTLALAGMAVATLESGFREDVQVGRGRAKQPSDDGGRGRGPSGEGCLMQPHPASAWRFADVDEVLRVRAAAGDAAAREAVVQSLLGTDPEAIRRCWRTGLRMLIRAREHCAWAAPDEPWDYAAVSLYGTGTSCRSANQGKTMARVRLFRRLVREYRSGAASMTD